MEKNLVTEAQRYLNSRHKDKRRSQVLRVVAVLVVFATVYALILPAVTMSNEVECGMVEHIHGEACWQEQLTAPQPQLVCAAQSSGVIVLHTHDSYCYDSQGELICPLEEREAHVHDSDCYREHRELICTETPDPGHTHGAACYARERGELICGLEETGAGHIHTDDCCLREQREELICGEEETGPGHTHTDDCYPQERTDELICGREEDEDHSHTEECYRLIVIRKELKCTLEETPDEKDEEGNVIVPGHKHTKECWKTDEELRICGQEETRGHVHTDACWRFEEEETLICGQEEAQGHTHSDQCYEWTPRLICQEEERLEGHVHTDDCYEITQVFVCLKQELAPHTHGEGCYDESGTLICGLPEAVVHQHTEACFVTPEGEPEPTRTLICGQEEHTHVEQCYVKAAPKEEQTFYCGLNEHIHTMPECYFETGTLRCTLIEHVHDLTCMEPPVEPVASEEPTESLEPSESLDPEASQDPAESDPAASEDPVSSEEPVRPVIEGVELENAEFPDVYVSDAFSLSFTVSGFAPVAEGQQLPQSSGEAPVDPAPAPSGEELVEITNEMVPLAAGPRMLSFTAASVDSAPYSGPDLDSAAVPTINEFDGTTELGSGSEPRETAVENSSHPPLNNQEQADLEPAETQTVPAFAPSDFTIVVPTTPAPELELEPERVLLDPDQIQFVVEPLEDEEEWENALAAAAEMNADERATVLQMFTVSAYAGDGRKLDMSGWKVYAKAVLTQEAVDYAASLGEEQISTISETYDETEAGQSGGANAVTLSVMDLTTYSEVAHVPMVANNVVEFPVDTRSGDGKAGLMLFPDVNPRFTVQYYANLKTPAKGEGALPFIDTSADANGGKATLPTNTTTPATTSLQLNKNGTVEFEDSKLQMLYREKQFTFNPNGEELTIDKLFGMMKETATHYELKELWVLKGDDPTSTNPDDWDAYTENLTGLRFSNNPEAMKNDPDVIAIVETAEKKTVLRLVYDPVNNDNVPNPATFYDYDITNGELKKDGKVVTGAAANGQGPYTTTSKESGINSPGNYTGSGAKFAFGNANTGMGLDGQTWNGNVLNKYNSISRGGTYNSYQGCTFGLVTGVTNENELQFASGVNAPKLFGSAKQEGKAIYGNSMLTFKAEGDTHTLAVATVRDADGNVLSSVSGLDSFGHPGVYDGQHNKLNWQGQLTADKTNVIWTNHFWPMDGVRNDDPLFGEMKGEDAYATPSDAYKLTGSGVLFPISDDGIAHNSYFGMSFKVEFPLSEEYVGPLEYYFYGDDDMWVFLDGKLVCDIGGVHSSVGQYVNLWDYLGTKDENGVWKPNQNAIGNHTLQFFYTERGASGSTCWMQYTLPNALGVPEGNDPGENRNPLSIEKYVAGNAADDQMDREFLFQLTLDGTDHRYPIVVYDGYDLVGMKWNPEKEWYEYDPDWTVEGATNPETGEINYPAMIIQGATPLRFHLRNGWRAEVQDLYAGVRYKVEEILPEDEALDCVTSVQIDGGTIANGTSTGEFKSLSSGGATVAFTNNFNYELPETGGAGTWYTMAGVPLMAAAFCLWYKKKRWGEGAAD